MVAYGEKCPGGSGPVGRLRDWYAELVAAGGERSTLARFSLQIPMIR
jgi:hypothetical protein